MKFWLINMYPWYSLSYFCTHRIVCHIYNKFAMFYPNVPETTNLAQFDPFGNIGVEKNRDMKNEQLPIFYATFAWSVEENNTFEIVFNWNHFEMRLLNLGINFFIYCGLSVLILVVFVLFFLSLRFGQISPLAFFRWFTATSDRNAESCNRIPGNYCFP